MMRIFMLYMSIACLTICMAGCLSDTSRYRDRDILFAPAEKLKVTPQTCNAVDIKTAQNNPACIGKTLRAANANSGTITILPPGPAVPMANVDTANLAAPN